MTLNNLRKIAAFTCVLLLITTSASAQGLKEERKQHTEIRNNSIQKIGDSIVIGFDVDVEKLTQNTKLMLTPVIYSELNSIELKNVVFAGFVKSIVDSRKGRGSAYVTNIRKRELIHYSTSIEFEEWMSSSSLRADVMVEAYGVEYKLSPILISNNMIPKPISRTNVEEEYKDKIEDNMQATFSFVQETPSSGAYFENSRDQGIVIDFKQGSDRIDTSYRDNKINLQKILDAVKLIESDPNIKLDRVTITGKASPEGSYAYNLKLAENRAKRLINNLDDIDSDRFQVNNIGEDWEGLRELVEESDMAYRDEVLDIIDNVPIHSGRQSKLMLLASGDPYRYMLNNYFEKLRSASFIQVFYTVAPNIAIETEQHIIELVDQKRYNYALELLETLEVNTSVYNLKGICYMMLDNIEDARTMFNHAIEGGSEHAKHNLEELKDREKSYRIGEM